MGLIIIVTRYEERVENMRKQIYQGTHIKKKRKGGGGGGRGAVGVIFFLVYRGKRRRNSKNNRVEEGLRGGKECGH